MVWKSPLIYLTYIDNKVSIVHERQGRICGPVAIVSN